MRLWQPFPWIASVFIAIASWATPALVQAQQTPPPSLFIEGYSDQLSYAPGDEVALHVSTTAAKYSITVDRIGGTDQRVLEKSEIAGSAHPIPDNASSHGCGWPAGFRFQIPADWQSGYYQVTLKAEDGGGPFVARNRRTAEGSLFFVVRAANPGRNSKILLQLSTNTYNAYTNWGGHSLYAYHGRNGLQGNRVSFNRPLSSQFYNWEAAFVRWAEKNGYALDYAVNSDLEFRPELLQHYRLVLSVGHDEYWSKPMRDHLEQFIGGGGNVAFFSGNTCCWQVRSEEEGRALVCYKQSYNVDPIYREADQSTLSTLWSHHLLERPENQLTGVGFLWGGYHRSHGQFMDGPASYEVHRPEHWVFEGTNLKLEDRFGGEDSIVGYECDGCEFELRDGLPVPTGRDGTPDSFEILGTCPARWAPGDSVWYERFPKDRVGAAVMGLYTRGGTVFTCGSTDWAHGLRGEDPVVEQITKNVLDRLAGAG
ncbi:N,N-dimethylformamidase beta subunit family domain-containing protein [Candidatus Laterigemmans baculatus]|uniref:N,N-dimethylformamidase beta subunit family domain-containing protein n=1 Tax=Candidatus Laterigemmans baculatus TaxID=2770505 RepID=UPI00193B075F|nr:N,N-dimethylformamidase beta subunit family domain-containing protein [Candidatus Laterigemmans baculatus]